MKTNRKGTSSHSNKRLLFVVLGLLVLAAMTVSALVWLKDTKKDPARSSNEITADKTRPAESEGSTFPVPDNVPVDAIKNYKLVVDTEAYKIRKDADSNSYIITLYAIINRPDQYDTYKDQLAEYKRQALKYLQDQGVDTTKVTITYEPSEATDL